MHPTNKLAALALAACATAWTTPAIAQAGDAFPSRPIRLIVPFAPGGAADNNMRLVGQKLGERLGQPVIIDNKPGAAGSVAIQALRQAPKDGHTVMYTSVSSAVIAAKPNAPYSLARDFAPIIQTNAGPLLFYVRPDTPLHSMRELIAHIKANPGKLNYASIGVGSGPHLAMESFKQVFGLDILHIPYKSSAGSSGALVAGDVQIGLDPLSAVVPLLKADKVRPLAVTSQDRAKAYPSVPGMADAGLPQYSFTSWAGISAAPETPPAAIARLNAALNEVLKDPAVIASYANQAAEPVGGSPQDYQRFIEQETQRLRTIIENGKLSLD